jgi:hypothetical protein
MRSTRSRPVRLLASAALVLAISAAAAGCQTTQSAQTTGALPIASADRSDADWRHEVTVY